MFKKISGHKFSKKSKIIELNLNNASMSKKRPTNDRLFEGGLDEVIILRNQLFY